MTSGYFEIHIIKFHGYLVGPLVLHLNINKDSIEPLKNRALKDLTYPETRSRFNRLDSTAEL
jgi:hypothetical protein